METAPTDIQDDMRSTWNRFMLGILLRFCTDSDKKTEAEIDAEAPSTGVNTKGFDKLQKRFGEPFHCDGLRVLDVGCGVGDLAITMAREGADVTGIDVDAARIRQAEQKAAASPQGSRARFVSGSFLDFNTEARFDRIISLAAFEHIPTPERFLPKMAELLAPGGKILSMFGPLWLSPYGPHQYGYTKFPWVHLVFPESVVLAARRQTFRPTDPAMRYEDIRGGLNRLTVGRYRRYVDEAGLRFERFAINPQLRNPIARGLSASLAALPGIREFVAHTVLSIMVRNV